MNQTRLSKQQYFLAALILSILAAFVVSGCWAEEIPIPHPTSSYGFAQCPNDINGFYVIGGRDEWDSPLDHFLRYDASERIWYRLAPLPSAAIAPTATCFGGHIYVVTYEQHLYVYNIIDNAWTEAAPPPRAAWGAVMGAWDGMLFMVSGSPLDWNQPVQYVDIYDLAQDTWHAGAGQDIPVATILPGYVQAGPYLYVVGGFGSDSPAQNVAVTQRYNMSTDTWELGPTFTSARAAHALAIRGTRLYAIGGDVNGGDYLDETGVIENLDLSTWPEGIWGTGSEMDLPQALMFNSSGFCSESVMGGEIWSVGGAYPDWENMNAVNTNQYCCRSEEGKAITVTPIQSPEAQGGCLLGSFDVMLEPGSLEESGLPGETVTYTLNFTNTGDIPDAYDLSLTATWPTIFNPLEPQWAGESSGLVVTVTIPVDAPPGTMDVAEMMITSQGDPSLSASAVITTERFTGVLLEPASVTGTGVPGESLVYPVVLHNATGQKDTFNLELGAHEWETTLSADLVGPIADNGQEVFSVTVTIPNDAGWNLNDMVVVTATAVAPPNYSGTTTVTTQSYAPPQISISPSSLESTQYPNQVVTQTLTISNGNGLTLTFDILPYGVPESILHMHLDEPPGSATFYDSSGNGNHGICSEDTCPVAGVEGRFGKALFFDGENDYIEVPNSPDLNPLDAMSINAWILAEDWNGNRRILQKGTGDNQYRFLDEGPFQFGIHTVGQVNTNLPTTGHWHHVVGVYNGSMMQIWIDGELKAEQAASGVIPITMDPLYIGTKCPGCWVGDYFYGKIDEVVIFNRALSPEEVLELYLGGAYEDTPWLSIDPISGTIPANTALPIEVTFDASGIQPDIFTTTLYVLNNDPLMPSIEVPVTLTVEPTASMGWVEGTVRDLRTGEPMEATLIASGQPYLVTSDPDTGYYQFWLEQGTHTLEVSAAGYVSQTAEVEIVAQAGVDRDFALLLDAPWIQLSPESLEVTHTMGEVTTRTLTITNAGAVSMDFQMLIDEEKSLHIISDESWRVSPNLEPGWETIDFDDSAWEFSVTPAQCGPTNCWENPEIPTMWSEVQHQTIYLRKSFYIYQGHTISATVITSCDDDHDLYINGTLVASDWDGYAGPTLTTNITPYIQTGVNVLAIKANDTYGGCRHMCVDATIISFPEGINWLSTDPISGTIPVNTSLPIEVTFDATNQQPGIYSPALIVQSNDPLTPMAQIPLTMTVEPTSSMGWVEGTVTDLRTGDPMEATLVASGQPYTVTSDPDTGYYQFWLEQGTHMLEVSAVGYVSQIAEVEISAQAGMTQDFALPLDAPWIQLSPESLEVTQMVGEVTTHPLTISNPGAVTLTFQLHGNEPPGEVLMMHLDEPEGSTTFLDDSGYENHGSCSDGSCPIAGFDGHLGTSLFFDGTNDYIAVPNIPSLNPQEAIAISAWIFAEDWNGNRRILQKGNSDNQYLFGCSGGVDGTLQLRLADVGILNTDLPTPGSWHHVLGLYDGNVMQIWIDGQLSAEMPAIGLISATSDPLHIGTKRSGAPVGDYFHGLVDQVLIFDRSLSPDEITSLYSGGLVQVPWLFIDPISGTIPANSSLPIEATFDANGMQPDIYTTTLYILNNDPLMPGVEVPMTMTVEPTASMGWVEGTVTDLRTEEPLEATLIAYGQPYTVTSEPDTGYYQFWLEQGTHTLEVIAMGYVSQTAVVEIVAQAGVTQDFALPLDAPWIQLSPQSLEVTQTVGEVTTRTLTITNAGAAALNYHVHESITTDAVLYMHLDEPAGSTTFRDSSGNDYHGFCSAPTCPIAGAGGMHVNAVSFDGINDFIQLPSFTLGNAVSIGAWVYSHDVQAYYSRIVDFGNGSPSDNILITWEGSTGRMKFDVLRGSSSAYITTDEVFPENEWVHVVAVVDEDGMGYIYWNGVLVKSGQIHTPHLMTRDYQYIARSAWSIDDYFNGLIDELVVFDRAFSADEVDMLYNSSPQPAMEWLSIDPISGTIPANSSLPIEVTFDGIQPGFYSTTLYVQNNDPFKPIVEVPVSMTVNNSPGFGILEGTITGTGYCDTDPSPLDDAEVVIESNTGMTWTVPSDQEGHYSFWLDSAGSPYTVTFSAPEHETGAVSGVIIYGQQSTTIDFELRWLAPCLSVDPDSLWSIVKAGMTDTLTFTLNNTGGGEANFELIERYHGHSMAIEGELVELNIPAAPDAAPQGSAVAAGPYTPRPAQTYYIQRYAISQEAPSILLLHADDGDGQWIKDQLVAYGDIGVVDTYNARYDTPSLDYLLPYDIVLTWTNYKYKDPTAIGDVLADYVDRGGKVINMMYSLGEHGWEMKGRFMDENYTALNGGLIEYSTSCLGDTNPTHPILEGVSEVCEFYRLKDTYLTPGSSPVARWEDDELFVAVNLNSTVISVAGYVGYYYRWEGQMDLLIHNAILWLELGYDIPWLTTEPVEGTVPADNGAFTVEVVFDSLNYQANEFRADLVVRSNDPYKPDLQIPVTMTVFTLVQPLSVAIEGQADGLPGISYTFTATVNPISTTLPIEYIWQADGQDPITHTSGLSDTFSLTWDTPGMYLIYVSATNIVGTVNDTHTIRIMDEAISGLIATNDGPTLLGNTTTMSASVSSGTNVVFEWDFGDGMTGDGAGVTHVYAASGSYIAVVEAINSTNQMSTSTVVHVIMELYYQHFPLILNGNQSVRGGEPSETPHSIKTAHTTSLR